MFSNRKRFFLTRKIPDLFGIDLRSLALFRIGLALLLLTDLFNRSTMLKAHYTDFGVLPLAVWRERFPYYWSLSIHLLDGSLAWQILVFLVAAVLAFFLLLGYHTRLATCLSWFLLISLHTRNPLVLQGGDTLLRLLLFWSMFLPLGARYSLDSRLRPSAPEWPNPLVSMGTVALLLQICFVYWFGVGLKSHRIWWQEGSAVYYALSIDQYATLLGHFLLNFPVLLRLLTYTTILIELLGPILAFSPVYTGPMRLGVVLIFVLFHLSLGLAMELGHFPYISIVGWWVFIPAWFWDHLFPRLVGLLQTRLPLQEIPSALSKLLGTLQRNQSSPTIYAGLERRYTRYLTNILAAFFLGYVLVWNLRTLDSAPYNKIIPRPFYNLGLLFRLDQTWNMFAPYPLTDDGWYVIPGQLKDGTVVDLFRDGAPVSWEKPPLVSALYKNQRWRKYMMNLWKKRYAKHRLYYGRYLCRDWNSRYQGEKQLGRTRDDGLYE